MLRGNRRMRDGDASSWASSMRFREIKRGQYPRSFHDGKEQFLPSEQHETKEAKPPEEGIPLLHEAIKRAQEILANQIPVVDLHEEVNGEESVSVTFRRLTPALLAVSDAIAKINAARLSKRQVAKKVEKVSELEWEIIGKLVRRGKDIAIRLLETIEQYPGSMSTRYEIFLSHPGQEKLLYVKPGLWKSLFYKGFQIFLDEYSMQPIQTTHPHFEMLEAALTAKLVISSLTYHAVQAKWPTAELLCGLARNEKYPKTHPLLIDASPGHYWFQQAGNNRNILGWTDDLTSLFPDIPTVLKMQPGMIPSEHAQAVVDVAIDHLKPGLGHWLRGCWRCICSRSSPGPHRQVRVHPSDMWHVNEIRLAIAFFLFVCAGGFVFVLRVGNHRRVGLDEGSSVSVVESGSSLRGRNLHTISAPASSHSAYDLGQTFLGNRPFGHFGQRMALDGETLVVGEPGHYVERQQHGPQGLPKIYPDAEAHIYCSRLTTENRLAWAFEQTLTGCLHPDNFQEFYVLQVSKTTILIDTGPEGWLVVGSRINITLLDFLAAGWSSFKKNILALFQKQPRSQDMMGVSVCRISPTLLAVGVPYQKRRSGAVFLYSHNGGAWAEHGMLTVSGSSRFGFNCAVAKDNPNAILVASAGAAHLFKLQERCCMNSWVLVKSFYSPNGRGSNDNFGSRMAMTPSTNEILISAPNASFDAWQEAGAVYVYRRRGPL